jgi:hypothetical protein
MKLKCDEQQSLHTKTLELLKADSRKLPDIFAATGLPFYWLRQFSMGTIKNPSVNRIQYLYECLSGKKLI